MTRNLAAPSSPSFRKTALAAALSGLFFLPAAPALAATITVANGGCTLIDAITAANSNSATGSRTAGNGDDTIVLPEDSTQTLTVANNILDGVNGLPSITSAITIQGNGSTITRQAGSPRFRIFHVASVGNLTLQETAVTGGFASDLLDANYYVVAGKGGAIYNLGTLTLSNSTLQSNSATNGGGIPRPEPR
ncbi:MAG: hypothetical protein ACT4QA_12800 [Panacagrimonas sp.]